MYGSLNMSNNKIASLNNPTSAQDLSTKGYIDTITSLKLSKTGGTMNSSIDMNLNKTVNHGDPINAQDAVTKQYLDTVEGGIQKFWVATGIFPNTTNVIIGLLTFSAGKSISNDKMIILKMFVERALDEWFDICTGGFNDQDFTFLTAQVTC